MARAMVILNHAEIVIIILVQHAGLMKFQRTKQDQVMEIIFAEI